MVLKSLQTVRCLCALVDAEFGLICCLQLPVGEWARSVEELPIVSAYAG